MKQTILFFVYMSVCCLAMQAQTTGDAQRIAIHAVVPDEGHPEAAANLETKLTRMLTANGFADNGYTDRFVLTAKIDVLSKDIAPTTPARVSQKLEVTLMVGDVVGNRIYESHTLSLSGIGTTETKALIAAFQRINPQKQGVAGHTGTGKSENCLVLYRQLRPHRLACQYAGRYGAIR